jgi:hypothetical protein
MLFSGYNRSNSQAILQESHQSSLDDAMPYRTTGTFKESARSLLFYYYLFFTIRYSASPFKKVASSVNLTALASKGMPFQRSTARERLEKNKQMGN